MSTPLSIAVSNRFKHNIFPDNAKVACVKPLDKKRENKHSISNFRPVIILNTFSKIYEKFSKEFLISEIEMFLSPFLAAYRKWYSTQHVLVKMMKEWTENLDKFFFVGAVLTDLSKAFDCLPHDFLIAKLLAYGLSSDSLCYIYSCLKDRKQCVKIHNKQSEFDTVISVVPQSSTFGSILFNVFFNNFFFFIRKESVHNFEDDNTLCSFAKILRGLVLQSDCETAIELASQQQKLCKS